MQRTWLITGCSTGFGRAMAKVLLARGDRVAATARRPETLDELVARHSEQALALKLDITREDDIAAAVAACRERFGVIDVLVNNAGYGVPSPAESESIDRFEQTMDINVTAPFHLAQLAGRHMLAAGSGSIVNIASVLGLAASAPIKEVSYCASKGAVVNLTRELGAQWGRKGVRVNAIAPGWFETEMNDNMFATESGMAYIVDGTPMGRPGYEGELDGALLFLASDASSFVTGQVLFVDGGWTAI